MPIRRTLVGAAVVAVATTGLAATAGTAAAAPPADSPHGTYIVTVDESAVPVQAAARAQRQLGGRITHVYDAVLDGFAIRLPTAAAERLSTMAGVVAVEADLPVRLTTTQDPPTWGLDRIDQRTLPLSTTYSYTGTGAGVTAYVIDTGIRMDHSDLGGRATPGFDAFGGTAVDCNGHGTHVAGTIGGTTYGVAKDVALVAVRVLDCNGSGSTSGVIAGIDWVTAQHGLGRPAVANMSLGGGASTALDTAVKDSIADGITYAVAAGNGNQAGKPQNACNYSPARVPAALTVAASDKSDGPASFSNYGACVDLFAPGVGIRSAWHTATSATATISGTSMATPHVAGVAALHLQGVPDATPEAVSTAITALTTKDAVKTSRTANNDLLHSAY